VDVEVIIEIPMGSRNKYKMDLRTGRVRLDRMLFTSTRYPLDYGFIPGTLAIDGEPLDALVWLEEPAFPGVQVTVRPVGMFVMYDEDGLDGKVLSVVAHDPRMAGIRELDDVPVHLRAEISHFFNIYKELEPGTCTEVLGWRTRAGAEQGIEAARARARAA
jgi:inorganic pyrophosphatase